MISRSILCLALVLIAFLAGCTKPPHLQIDAVSSALEPFAGLQPELSQFKGSGDFTISQNGRRNSGKADVLWDSSGHLRAYIYSPFGSRVASIEADRQGGRIIMDEREYVVALEDSMDDLPFLWARYFTFGQFVRFLTGRMPDDVAHFSSRPDSLTHDRTTATAIWKRESVNVRALVRRRSGTVESISYNYNYDGDRFSADFGLFTRGLAREIIIRDDSRNYISLRYDIISAQ